MSSPARSFDYSRTSTPRMSRSTPVQRAELEKTYAQNDRPSISERRDLADRIGMDPKHVDAWFASRRSNEKKKDCVASDAPVQDSMDGRPVRTSRFRARAEPYPSGPRRRTRPSAELRKEMEAIWVENEHPALELREELADRYGVDRQKVTDWFRNRNSSAKRRKPSTKRASSGYEDDDESEPEPEMYMDDSGIETEDDDSEVTTPPTETVQLPSKTTSPYPAINFDTPSKTPSLFGLDADEEAAIVALSLLRRRA